MSLATCRLGGGSGDTDTLRCRLVYVLCHLLRAASAAVAVARTLVAAVVAAVSLQLLLRFFFLRIRVEYGSLREFGRHRSSLLGVLCHWLPVASAAVAVTRTLACVLH